ncbi:MAG: hypothetical protein NUW37_08645 [Planctomycetes bacterium]|nr:hypothetical protein [Planctomycetota bacterium]
MIVLRFVVLVIVIVALALSAAAYPVHAEWGKPGLEAIFTAGIICTVTAILGLAPLMLVPAVTGQARLRLPMLGFPVRIIATLSGLFLAQKYGNFGDAKVLLGFSVISLYILLLGLETWFIIRLNKLFLAAFSEIQNDNQLPGAEESQISNGELVSDNSIGAGE